MGSYHGELLDGRQLGSEFMDMGKGEYNTATNFEDDDLNVNENVPYVADDNP